MKTIVSKKLCLTQFLDWIEEQTQVPTLEHMKELEQLIGQVFDCIVEDFSNALFSIFIKLKGNGLEGNEENLIERDSNN